MRPCISSRLILRPAHVLQAFTHLNSDILQQPSFIKTTFLFLHTQLFFMQKFNQNKNICNHSRIYQENFPVYNYLFLKKLHLCKKYLKFIPVLFLTNIPYAYPLNLSVFYTAATQHLILHRFFANPQNHFLGYAMYCFGYRWIDFLLLICSNLTHISHTKHHLLFTFCWHQKV